MVIAALTLGLLLFTVKMAMQEFAKMETDARVESNNGPKDSEVPLDQNGTESKKGEYLDATSNPNTAKMIIAVSDELSKIRNSSTNPTTNLEKYLVNLRNDPASSLNELANYWETLPLAEYDERDLWMGFVAELELPNKEKLNFLTEVLKTDLDRQEPFTTDQANMLKTITDLQPADDEINQIISVINDSKNKNNKLTIKKILMEYSPAIGGQVIAN